MILRDPVFWIGALSGLTWAVTCFLPLHLRTQWHIAKARRELAAARSIAISAIPIVLRIEPPPGVSIIAVEEVTRKPDKPS